PDGKQLVTGGADKTVRLFRVADGAALRNFAGATAAVNSVVVTADGANVVAAGADKLVRVWKLADAAQVVTFTHPAVVRSIAANADGSRIAAAGDDHIVRVWDVATGRELERFTGHTMPVLDVAFAADGKTVASSSADKSVRLSTPGATRVTVADEKHVNALSLTADGTKLVTGGADKLAKVWDVATGKKLLDLPGSAAALSDVAIRGDGGQVAAASADMHLHVWQLEEGGPKASKINLASPLHSVAFSADGAKLIAATADNHLRTYNSATGQLLEDITAAAPATTIAIAPDASSVVASAGNNAVIQQLSLERLIPAHEGAVTSLAYLPSGGQLVSGGADNTVRLWNIDDGQQTRSFAWEGEVPAEPPPAIKSVSVSTDGKKLVVGASYNKVFVYDIEGAAEASPSRPELVLSYPAPVRGVSAGADGSRVAACGDDNLVRVWDAASGKELQRFVGHTMPAVGVALAADNKTLVSGSADKQARVWSIAAAQILLAGKSTFRDLAFVPDGLQLVTVGSDGMTRFWDQEGKQVRQLEKSQTSLVRVAVRPDGAQLAIADEKSAVKVLRLEDAAVLHEIPPAPVVAAAAGAPVAVEKKAEAGAEVVASLSFSPDNAKLAVGDANVVRVFDATNGR
ncbi:MAG: WD40 repeat domain-containing protein, partial [Pirellulales bacterium]